MARRRRRKGTQAAPRRRRRHRINPGHRRASARRAIRHYRRNPGMGGILGQSMDLFKGSGGILAGWAGSKAVSDLIPFGAGNPLLIFAKEGAVAIGIRWAGGRFLGPEWGKLLAYGAMARALKNVLVAQLPQAGAFLGTTDAVTYFPSRNPWNVASYADGDAMSSYSNQEGVGSYSGSYSG